jgi:ADP-ribose pyrophosphatase YjhB (NUDIX family)
MKKNNLKNNLKNIKFCNNCSTKGHNFHNCKYPITSIGIIVYRYNKILKENEYLMIRRRNTLGFMEFIRGKYNIFNKIYIMNIIDEMTNYEKELLLTKTFEELWKYLWNNNIALKYRNEHKNAKEKFESLKNGIITKNDSYNIETLLENSKTSWVEEEWGFPKGRRNYQEKDIYTAIREFTEETGISKSEIDIIQNLVPFEEVFTGSNFKSYKHKYYVAYMKNDDENINYDNYKNNEVSKLEWNTFHNCIKKIRNYNTERMIVIDKIHKTLKQTKQKFINEYYINK